MGAWLVALISGGLTLAAALLTTYLNGRSGARNLGIQLESEDRRHAAQLRFDERKHEEERRAAHQALVFDNQYQAAVSFLSSFAAYRQSASSTLGAMWMLSQLGSTRNQPDRGPGLEALEERFGYRAALMTLLDAEAAVAVCLPDDIATTARTAMRLELDWTNALREHYERDEPDPGPHPVEVATRIDAFRAEVKQLLGVDNRTP